SITNLNNILKNLIEVASIEKAIREREKIDFKDEISNVLESLIMAPEYENVKVYREVAVEKNFYGNKKMLFAVLQNLLENSFKYRNFSCQDSYVKVRVYHFYKGIQLIVEDNGIGIASHFQGKVYDMFFRGTNQAEGNGLGLYLVRNYVFKMGGEISLYSEEGNSTKFTIYLPTME